MQEEIIVTLLYILAATLPSAREKTRGETSFNHYKTASSHNFSLSKTRHRRAGCVSSNEINVIFFLFIQKNPRKRKPASKGRFSKLLIVASLKPLPRTWPRHCKLESD
jgi:hypothetical protein